MLKRTILLTMTLTLFSCSKKDPKHIYDEPTTSQAYPGDLHGEPSEPAVYLTLPGLKFEYTDNTIDPNKSFSAGFLGAANCNELAIQAADKRFLVPAALMDAEAIGLNTSSNSGAFYADPACKQAIIDTSIPAGHILSIVYYQDPFVGTVTLTVSDHGKLALTSATVPVTMTATTTLAFTPATLKQKTTDCGHLVVQAQNSSGAIQKQLSDLAIRVHSSSFSERVTGVFYRDQGCTEPLASTRIVQEEAGLLINYSTTIEAGSGSIDLYYKDNKAGSADLWAQEIPSRKFVAASMTATIAD